MFNDNTDIVKTIVSLKIIKECEKMIKNQNN